MLLLHPHRERTVAELSALSRESLDVALEGSAHLVVSTVATEGVLLGAFQRPGDLDDDGLAAVFPRGSGGPAAELGPGTVHVLLRMATPQALVECDGPRLLNRYVRPLLRALTNRVGPASYFGRDWVSIARRPVALVAFAHDAETERSVFEAVVAVRTPFSREERESYRGGAPATLEDLGARAEGADPAAVARRVISAYGQAYEGVETPKDPRVPKVAPLSGADIPWAARVDEALGFLAAGRDSTGLMRLGGELMVSRDVLRELETSLVKVRAPSEEALAALVNTALQRPRATLFGVKDASSLVSVLAQAYGAEA